MLASTFSNPNTTPDILTKVTDPLNPNNVSSYFKDSDVVGEKHFYCSSTTGLYKLLNS